MNSIQGFVLKEAKRLFEANQAQEQHEKLASALEVIQSTCTKKGRCYIEYEERVHESLRADGFNAEACWVKADVILTNDFDGYGNTLRTVEKSRAIFVSLDKPSKHQSLTYFINSNVYHKTIYRECEITEQDCSNFSLFEELNREL